MAVLMAAHIQYPTQGQLSVLMGTGSAQQSIQLERRGSMAKVTKTEVTVVLLLVGVLSIIVVAALPSIMAGLVQSIKTLVGG